MYITPTDIVFDSIKLRADALNITNRYNTNINLRKQKDVRDDKALMYCVGSLHDPLTNKWLAYERDFTTPIGYFSNMYIAEVIREIEVYAKQYHNLSIGRARLLTLQPKSTLSLHKDYMGRLRFHVPIITNDSALFIHRDTGQYTVSTMSEVGRLYTFDASVEHTAINASQMHARTHLVVVGY